MNLHNMSLANISFQLQIRTFDPHVRDIRQRKQIAQAFRESEEKYRIISENTSDLIALLNVDGLVNYASPSHQQLIGFRPDEIVGTSPFSLIHEDDRSRVQAVFQQMIEEKSPKKAEFRIVRRDGRTVDLEATGTPVLSENGEVSMVVVVSRDITERKKSEALFRKSEKLAMAGQLAASIAHEIRNPLATLKGFIQFMQSGTIEKPRYYEIIRSELNRIEQYTNELLILAKPQAVTFISKNVGTILYAVTALLESEAILNKVYFVIDIEDALPPVKCEEHQLKQVFINILQNAIEAMPQGGNVYISVLAQEEGNILIRFRDEGSGIPKERIPCLGEPFYTTKEKGTGLGLTISFKIIEEHKGSIHIQSEQNKGATIDVILPIHQ